MSFDKNLPDGGKSLRLSDEDLRANFAALEAALGDGHRFSTGGTQDGKHTVVHYIREPEPDDPTEGFYMYSDGADFPNIKRAGATDSEPLARTTWVADNYLQLSANNGPLTGKLTIDSDDGMQINSVTEHYRSKVTDDSNTNVFKSLDSNGNDIFTLQARSMDGNGAGYFNINPANTEDPRAKDNVIYTEGLLPKLLDDLGYSLNFGDNNIIYDGSVIGSKGYIQLFEGLIINYFFCPRSQCGSLFENQWIQLDYAKAFPDKAVFVCATLLDYISHDDDGTCVLTNVGKSSLEATAHGWSAGISIMAVGT